MGTEVDCGVELGGLEPSPGGHLDSGMSNPAVSIAPFWVGPLTIGRDGVEGTEGAFVPTETP